MNIRRFSILFIIFAVIMLLTALPVADSAQAKGGNNQVVVVATGHDEANCERADLPGVFVTQDVCNVQAAVNDNPGGTILLRGTFHFAEYGEEGYIVQGTDGTVFITHDIEIKGERDGNEFQTTIKGGHYTFSIGYLPIEWEHSVIWDEIFSSPDNAVPVNATIKNIEFDNTSGAAIRVWSTTGLTIKGNRIVDGRSGDLSDLCGPCHAQGFGIFAAPPGWWISDNPHLISGEITIKENHIDGRFRRAEADDPGAVPSDGILIRGLTGSGIFITETEAEITIKDNELYNMWGGIDAQGNAGFTKIIDNRMYLPAEDFGLYGGYGYVTGINTCGWCWNDAYETAKYIIKGNDIAIGGHFVDLEGSLTFGIWSEGSMSAPIISNNKINLLSDGWVGINITEGSFGEVKDNVIEGEGQHAILLGYPGGPSEVENNGNIVKNNEVGDFYAAVSDYLLGPGVTNNELYVDPEATVIDDSGNDTNIIHWDD